MKNILFVIVLLFGSLCLSVFAQQDSKARIDVYYFHGNARCVSCKKIEQYTKKAIEEFFKPELESEYLSIKVVNTEEPGNEHYIEDYQLYTKSVVLSHKRDGRETKYKNLEKVWQYLQNQERFSEYIRNEIESFMRNGS